MGLSNFITRVNSLMEGALIPIAFTLCLIYFSWGVAQYIKNSDSAKASEQAKNVMVWGLVGLFVAVSIWGLVALLKDELDIPDYNQVRIR
jgi:hypothetical protein